MNKKRCSKCGHELPLEEFSTRSDNGRPMSACRRCNAERVRKARGERAPVHQSVNGEHSPVLEEILAELRAIRAENAELRQMIAALSDSTQQRPAADVNIHIKAELDQTHPRVVAAKNKLMGFDFVEDLAALEKRKRH